MGVLVALCWSLKLSVLIDGVKMASPLSLIPEWGVHVRYSSGSPYRRGKMPILCPWLPLDSCLTLSVSEIPSSQVAQYSCVLSQTHVCVSKLPILGNWDTRDPCWSHHNMTGTGLYQKCSHQATQLFEVNGKLQWKNDTKVCCPWQVPQFLC